MALLFTGLLIALILAEVFVAYVIHYPAYGVQAKLIGIRKSQQTQNVWKPYSEYFNVEGGNKVFKRNNLGFPGMDVAISDSSKYIFLLGSSFIEAYQVEPEKMASAIFASHIQQTDPTLQVINLGCSGHDPYDDFFRAFWLTRTFQPNKVILVLEGGFERWLKRQKHPLDFHTSNAGITADNKMTTRIMLLARNHSALLNLFAQSLKSSGQEEGSETKMDDKQSTEEIPSEDLFQCLIQFRNTYGERFMLISTSDMAPFNRSLSDFCERNQIVFKYNERIVVSENRFNGSGHLNVQGNKILGQFFAEVYEAHR